MPEEIVEAMTDAPEIEEAMTGATEIAEGMTEETETVEGMTEATEIEGVRKAVIRVEVVAISTTKLDRGIGRAPSVNSIILHRKLNASSVALPSPRGFRKEVVAL